MSGPETDGTVVGFIFVQAWDQVLPLGHWLFVRTFTNDTDNHKHSTDFSISGVLLFVLEEEWAL